jgi:hypothetical protein
MISLEVNNWALQPGQPAVNPVGTSVKDNLLNFRRSSTMAGWRVPEHSELEQLLALVKSAGGQTGKDSDTQAALQKLGFTGLSTDHDNYKKFWYNGSVFQDSNTNHIRFQYLDFSTGKDDYLDKTVFDEDEDPSFTYAYVRTLRGLTYANRFGDTGQQLHLGYGQTPDGVQLLDVSSNNPHPGSNTFTYVLQGSDGTEVTSDLGGAAVWTLKNPSSQGVAFLNYNRETSGQRRNLTEVVFRRPGTVTVQATAPTGAVVTQVLTGSLRPALNSIQISPQNLALQTLPALNDFQQFYCTGYIATGETVDLTARVTWSISSAIPASAIPPRILSGGSTPGDLIFGNTDSLSSLITVKAVYTAGSDTNQDWSDGGGSFTDTSTFSVPVRQ